MVFGQGVPGYLSSYRYGQAASFLRVPRPGDKEFTCCKGVYNTFYAWKNHISSHVDCTLCQFSGSPKLVRIHCNKVHALPKPSKGKESSPENSKPTEKVYSEEEVASWIAERKRKYPRSVDENPIDEHAHTDKKKKPAPSCETILTKGDQTIDSDGEEYYDAPNDIAEMTVLYTPSQRSQKHKNSNGPLLADIVKRD
ncbi:hypothetical protein CLU79DRAFT_478697 [Phycomyces nitens]|nr:hypothetical protein CLU79DRAFT_478697 [Phycomyces nitens]